AIRPRAASRRRGQRLLDEATHIVGGNAALAARPLYLAQVHAQFAGKLAHRRRRVRQLAGRQARVFERSGGGSLGGWRGRRLGGGGVLGGGRLFLRLALSRAGRLGGLLRLGVAALAFCHHDNVTLGDLVAHFRPDFLDHAA